MVNLLLLNLYLFSLLLLAFRKKLESCFISVNPDCGWSHKKDLIDELVQLPSQPWKNTSYKKIHR